MDLFLAAIYRVAVNLLPVQLFWDSKAGAAGLMMETDSHTPAAPAWPQGVTFSYRQSKGRSSFRTRARPFYPHPFHMVLLGEVLRGLTQSGLSMAIRANYRYPVTGALGQARWGAQRPYGRAGVNLGQKEKATLGPTLSECLPGSTNW